MEEDKPIHTERQLGPEMVVKEPAWGGGRRLPVLWHSPLSCEPPKMTAQWLTNVSAGAVRMSVPCNLGQVWGRNRHL